MSNKQRKPPGKCIFCDGHGMTKQHIMPNWMNRAFPKLIAEHVNYKSTISNLHTPKIPSYLFQLSPPVRYQGSLGLRQLRLVCLKCNGGWMSTIEQQSKDIIIALITHKAIILSQEDQLKLASWIAQMTIVAEFTDIPFKVVPYRERKYFMDNKLPPVTWVIWIGKCESKDWQELAYKHRGVVVASFDKHEGELKQSPPKPSIQSSVFIFGGLFIMVLSTASDVLQPLIESFTYPELIKLWPAITDEIRWSDLPIVTDTEMLVNNLVAILMGNPIRGRTPDGKIEIINLPE